MSRESHALLAGSDALLAFRTLDMVVFYRSAGRAQLLRQIDPTGPGFVPPAYFASPFAVHFLYDWNGNRPQTE